MLTTCGFSVHMPPSQLRRSGDLLVSSYVAMRVVQLAPPPPLGPVAVLRLQEGI